MWGQAGNGQEVADKHLYDKTSVLLDGFIFMPHESHS